MLRLNSLTQVTRTIQNTAAIKFETFSLPPGILTNLITTGALENFLGSLPSTEVILTSGIKMAFSRACRSIFRMPPVGEALIFFLEWVREALEVEVKHLILPEDSGCSVIAEEKG